MNKFIAQVHRFRDCVSVFVEDGQSVYMKVDDAKAFASAILDEALDVERRDFQSSPSLTREFTFQDGRKEKVDRSLSPLLLYSVTGHIHGCDGDETMLLAARNEAEAHDAFSAELLACTDIKDDGKSVYVSNLQVIGPIANGFVKVMDESLLRPAEVDAVSDEAATPSA